MPPTALLTDPLSVLSVEAEASARLAVIGAQRSLTYAELAARVRERLTHLQELGLDRARGDRVLIVPRVDIRSVVDLLALLEAQIPTVLVHPRWSARERAQAIGVTSPRLVIDGPQVSVLPPTRRSGRKAPQVICFTSGTTGAPKGLRLSRRALGAAVTAHTEALPFEHDDRWALAMPLSHVGGLSILTRCLHARATVVLSEERFEPEAFARRALETRTTLASLVPTMIRMLLDAKVSVPSSLRAVLLGGAAASEALIEEARMSGWPVLPTYGLSECCAQAATQRLQEQALAGVGRPLLGVQISILNGEIRIKGSTLFDGWLDPPLGQDALRSGWYHTGDGGDIDAQGQLHVHGRLDDRIISGGENIDPREVVEALLRHPRIKAASVLGIDHRSWGQQVAALIVPIEGLSEPMAILDKSALSTIRTFLSPRLSAFKHPRIGAYVPTLPRTNTGKVDRRAVRSLLEEAAEGKG